MKATYVESEKLKSHVGLYKALGVSSELIVFFSDPDNSKYGIVVSHTGPCRNGNPNPVGHISTNWTPCTEESGWERINAESVTFSLEG